MVSGAGALEGGRGEEWWMVDWERGSFILWQLYVLLCEMFTRLVHGIPNLNRLETAGMRLSARYFFTTVHSKADIIVKDKSRY